MLLYVTVDTKTWARARFLPCYICPAARERIHFGRSSRRCILSRWASCYRIKGAFGTLFVSNSNGTFFVESLADTNRNEDGYVDYERVYGVDGIGIANVVSNALDVERRGTPKKLKSLITFNDGSSWAAMKGPEKDIDGNNVGCDTSNLDVCSLHLHSVTTPHNYGRIFSSPAPGFVMGVGSVGEHLRTYTESDTFLSTDGGLTWQMIAKGAHKYEFGDQGSIMVAVDDEEATDTVKYSLDLGKSWYECIFHVFRLISQ